MPASNHLKSLVDPSWLFERTTTGAPLIPRCVRASVKKYPWPWNRRSKHDAMIA